MPTKALSCKKKPYVNIVQKRRRVLGAKAHLKWTFTYREHLAHCDEDEPTSSSSRGECESVKGFKNDGSLAKALSCKVEFIYSARKIVHSEEYIKKGK